VIAYLEMRREKCDVMQEDSGKINAIERISGISLKVLLFIIVLSALLLAYKAAYPNVFPGIELRAGIVVGVLGLFVLLMNSGRIFAIARKMFFLQKSMPFGYSETRNDFAPEAILSISALIVSALLIAESAYPEIGIGIGKSFGAAIFFVAVLVAVAAKHFIGDSRQEPSEGADGRLKYIFALANGATISAILWDGTGFPIIIGVFAGLWMYAINEALA